MIGYCFCTEMLEHDEDEFIEGLSFNKENALKIKNNF